MNNKTQNPYLARKNNELMLGNYTIPELVAIAGQTPFYAYDASVIDKKIAQLRADLPKAMRIHYAIKANPMPSLVNYIAKQVDGLDVASHQELLLAKASQCAAEKISFAGPGKQSHELAATIALGATINVESLTELDRIKQLAKEMGKNANIAIRINPNFSLKGSGMKMGGGAQQFGIDLEQLDYVKAILPADGINLHGFHLYWGSQNLHADAIIEAHNQTFTTIDNCLQQFSDHKIQDINIGGGFGIPYFPNDQLLDTKKIGANLAQLLKQFPNIAQTQPIIELGRFLVAEAGIYVTQIIDKKLSRDTHFLICDGGLHHHLALSGNFGQVLRKNYPLEIVSRQIAADKQEQETVNIVGPLCTPLDILGNKMTLTKAAIDDYVVVLQSGAYGFSASPQHFLSHPRPVELFI